MGKDLNGISINELLKNALTWKQWIADDLRLLIQLKERDEVSTETLHGLVIHHLKVYHMMNAMFRLYTNEEDELFEFPSLDVLQKIVPTLDISSDDDLDKLVEPMLELELDDLSEELHEQMMKEVEDVSDSDSGIDVFITDEVSEELLDEEDIETIVEDIEDPVEDIEEIDSDILEEEEDDIVEENEVKNEQPETIEMVDDIWTTLPDDLIGVRSGNEEVSIDG